MEAEVRLLEVTGEYGNSFRYHIFRSLKSEAALRLLRFFVAGSLHAMIVINIILRPRSG